VAPTGGSGTAAGRLLLVVVFLFLGTAVWSVGGVPVGRRFLGVPGFFGAGR
jgi:hypothetical protein